MTTDVFFPKSRSQSLSSHQFRSMMASIYNLMAVFILLCCVTATFTQENSASQQAWKMKNTFFGCKIQPMNETTNLTGCKLYIHDSKIKEVLSKHKSSTTINIVRMTVSVVRTNKTRYCAKKKLAWASEVGRTILTLVERAKDIRLFRSPLFTSPLEVGTDEIDIQVKEIIDGCLPPGGRGSELIFDYLLRQLSHNDDTHSFKLCKAYDNTRYTTFNCCRIVGDGNLTICADYSSVVVEWALPVIGVIFGISTLMIVPFVLEYAMNCPKTKFYRISESHMSLLSIASVFLFEGYEPRKSFVRRFAFVVLSYLLAFFPDFFGFRCLQLAFIFWGVVFVVFYTIHLTDNNAEEKRFEDDGTRPKWGEQLIESFTLGALAFKEMTEKNPLTNCRGKLCNGSFLSCCSDILICVINSFLMLLFCLILPIILCCISLCILLMCLLKCILFDILICFCRPHYSFKNTNCWQNLLLVIVVLTRLATLAIFAFLTGMIFISALSLVASFTLNAEYFNPFIAPILTVIVYFWKDWKSSVEAECLQLKLSMIEVSKISGILKDKRGPDETGNNANSNNDARTFKERFLEFFCTSSKCSSEETHETDENTLPCSTNSPRSEYEELEEYRHGPENGFLENEAKNIIKFDKRGEVMVSKELYEAIRKKVLQLDHLLFYFFRRVVFVLLYAICMFVIITLVRESGVPESVQIISGILGALIPFLFDTIFADLHEEQGNAKNIAMKQKLEHMLKATKLDDNAILVEFRNVRDHTQSLESLKNLCEQIGPPVESFIALCKRIEPIHVSNLKCDQDGLQVAEYLVVVFQRITSTAESLVALYQKINAHVRCLVPLETNVKRLHEQIACTKYSFDRINNLIPSSSDSLKKIAEQITSAANSLDNIRKKIELYEDFVSTRREQDGSSVEFLIEISEQITTSADFLVAKCNQITSTAKQLNISPRSQLTESYVAVLERIRQIKQSDTEDFSQPQFATTIQTLVRMSENLEKFLVVTSKSIKETTEPLVPLYQQYFSGPSHPSTSAHTRV